MYIFSILSTKIKAEDNKTRAISVDQPPSCKIVGKSLGWCRRRIWQQSVTKTCGRASVTKGRREKMREGGKRCSSKVEYFSIWNGGANIASVVMTLFLADLRTRIHIINVNVHGPWVCLRCMCIGTRTLEILQAFHTLTLSGRGTLLQFFHILRVSRRVIDWSF